MAYRQLLQKICLLLAHSSLTGDVYSFSLCIFLIFLDLILLDSLYSFPHRLPFRGVGPWAASHSTCSVAPVKEFSSEDCPCRGWLTASWVCLFTWNLIKPKKPCGSLVVFLGLCLLSTWCTHLRFTEKKICLWSCISTY